MSFKFKSQKKKESSSNTTFQSDAYENYRRSQGYLGGHASSSRVSKQEKYNYGGYGGGRYWDDDCWEGSYSYNSTTSTPTSYSSYWTSQFSRSQTTYEEKNNALETIGRTVYILGTKDKEFKLKFKDGKEPPNYFLGNIIYFDEAIIEQPKTGFDGVGQKTDVLCGEALIQSALRVTIKDKDKALKLMTDGSDFQKYLYPAIEVFQSKKYVRQECPGFDPYLCSRTKYFMDPTEVNKYTEEKDSYVSALFSIAHHLYGQESEADFKEYQVDVDFVDQLIASTDPKSVTDTVSVVDKIIKYIEDKYEIPDNPPPPPIPSGGLPEGSMGKEGEAPPELAPANEIEQDNKANDVDSAVVVNESQVKPMNVDNLAGNCNLKQITLKNPSRYATDYTSMVSNLKKDISSIKEKLIVTPVEQKIPEKALRSGYLDEGSLDKLCYNSDYVFERHEIVGKPQISVSLLIDESGSMNYYNGFTGAVRYGLARNCAIVLYEALKTIEGVQVAVYGHTADSHWIKNDIDTHYRTEKQITKKGVDMDCVLIKYITPTEGNANGLATVTARANNADGYAMHFAAQDILRWADSNNNKNYMFVISDGEPHASAYGSKAASDHMNKVIANASALGVEIYGIGIDNAFSAAAADKMYGPGRCVVIKDVKSSVNIISNFINKQLGQM